MTDIMAAIGLGQLSRYPEMLKRRKRIVEIYERELPMDKICVLNHGEGSVMHLYMIRLKEKNREERDVFIEEMAKFGVSCNVHYKPLPMHTAYRNIRFDIADFPQAYASFENEVTLPLNSKMSEEDAYYVAECVNRLL